MSRPYEVSNSITEVFVQCNIIINFYHIQIERLLVFFQFYFFYLFCNLFCEQFIFIYIHKKALIYLHKWVSKLWTWSKFAPWPKILIKSYKSLRETRPYKSFSGATQIIAIWNHWRSKAQIKNRYRWHHEKLQNYSTFDCLYFGNLCLHTNLFQGFGNPIFFVGKCCLFKWLN